MSNKVVHEAKDAYDPEHDEALAFQDKVLSCLSEVLMYNSHILKNSEKLEKSVENLRYLIHGEEI